MTLFLKIVILHLIVWLSHNVQCTVTLSYNFDFVSRNCVYLIVTFSQCVFLSCNCNLFLVIATLYLTLFLYPIVFLRITIFFLGLFLRPKPGWRWRRCEGPFIAVCSFNVFYNLYIKASLYPTMTFFIVQCNFISHSVAVDLSKILRIMFWWRHSIYTS